MDIIKYINSLFTLLIPSVHEGYTLALTPSFYLAVAVSAVFHSFYVPQILDSLAPLNPLKKRLFYLLIALGHHAIMIPILYFLFETASFQEWLLGVMYNPDRKIFIRKYFIYKNVICSNALANLFILILNLFQGKQNYFNRDELYIMVFCMIIGITVSFYRPHYMIFGLVGSITILIVYPDRFDWKQAIVLGAYVSVFLVENL